MRYLEAALASPVDKDAAAGALALLRTTFGRSLVARHALSAGHVLQAHDLTAKKPGGTIPPDRLQTLIGTRPLRPLRPDEPIREDDIEALA